MAIDDEPLALQQIVAYIGKVPFLELIVQCQSALEAREFLEHDTVDAIFCDINMPDLNGMDFIKSLTVPPPMPNMPSKASASMPSTICSSPSACKTSNAPPTG